MKESSKKVKLAINEWAEEDRPREKLIKEGADALTNAELLAILIRSGSQKESAVDLMKRLINDCGNKLSALGKMTVSDLMRYNGIGSAKAVTIIAASTLGKRRATETAEQRPDMSCAQYIYELMLPRMQDLDVEEAWVVLMNNNYKLIATERLSHGGLSETAVDVRLLLKAALLRNATIVALCHNHPSNNCMPSHEDDRLTQRVANACETMRIYFCDHLIITDGQYYSYREKGRL